MKEKNDPYGDNGTKVMVQSVDSEDENRESRLIENETNLVLVSISISFVANRSFEQLLSSVKV